MTLHVRLGIVGMRGRKVLAEVCIPRVTLSIFAMGNYEGIFLFFWGRVSSGYSEKKYTTTKLEHKTIENKTTADIQIRSLVFEIENKVSLSKNSRPTKSPAYDKLMLKYYTVILTTKNIIFTYKKSKNFLTY